MSLLSSYIKKQIKKKGLGGFLIKVGDLAVKITPTRADNIAWAKIKALILELYGTKSR